MMNGVDPQLLGKRFIAAMIHLFVILMFTLAVALVFLVLAWPYSYERTEDNKMIAAEPVYLTVARGTLGSAIVAGILVYLGMDFENGGNSREEAARLAHRPFERRRAGPTVAGGPLCVQGGSDVSPSRALLRRFLGGQNW